MDIRHPYWARRELARLDPASDARRMAHLLLEVRYGEPRFIHPMFSLAFSRQVAIPAIARVLYRDGKGIIMSQTAKRNDDTLVFFGLLLRHGNSPAGMQVVERMNRMHARYPIPNELNLYTLSTLACLPQRLGRQFTGRDLFDARESEAVYRFWAMVGEMMGIHDIPGSAEAMLQWMVDYERSEFGSTRDGHEVTMALAREYAQRWYPARLQDVGQRIFFAMFDDHLRETQGVPEVSTVERELVAAAVKAFVLSRQVLPDPGERDLLGMFGQAYSRTPAVEQVGPAATS